MPNIAALPPGWTPSARDDKLGEEATPAPIETRLRSSQECLMDYLREQQKKTRLYLYSSLLWLLTSLLGVIAFLAGRRVILSTFSRFFPGQAATSAQNAFSLLNILITLPLSFLMIVVIIGGFEYHLREKRLGSPQSWRFFARTLAVEAGLIMLATFL